MPQVLTKSTAGRAVAGYRSSSRRPTESRGATESVVVRGSLSSASADEPPSWVQDLLRRFGRAIEAGVRHAIATWGRREDFQLIPDLVQETYCHLLDREGRRLLSIRGADDLKCRRWLRRVAEHVALDHIRARNCVKRGAGIHFDRLENYIGYVADLREGPEETLLRRDEMRSLFAACRRVTGSECNARLAALALIGGWSSRQLSQLRGVSTSRTGIDSLLCRARRRLVREGFSLPLRYTM